MLVTQYFSRTCRSTLHRVVLDGRERYSVSFVTSVHLELVNCLSYAYYCCNLKVQEDEKHQSLSRFPVPAAAGRKHISGW
jgi:isopenicillin N synthase-like dioxygenase